MRFSRVLGVLDRGEIVAAPLVWSIPHWKVADILGKAGFEAVVIELEHSDFALPQVSELMLAARANDMDAVVRIQDGDPGLIAKVLEAGAQGVIVAHCRDAEHARSIVQRAKFAPLGLRAVGGGVDADYGSRAMSWNAYAQHANQNTFVGVIIEDARALADVDSIAAVEGLDLLLLGPGDLLQSARGNDSRSSDRIVLDAIQRVSAACSAHGKHFGGFGAGSSARELLNHGARFICLGRDTDFLARGARHALASTLEHANAVGDKAASGHGRLVLQRGARNWLNSPFCRLPLRCDAQRLRDEVDSLPPNAWYADRLGAAQYTSIPLVSWRGMHSEQQCSPFAATPILNRLPYVKRILSSLNAPLCEVRLRRLRGTKEAFRPHIDNAFPFFRRMRLHVPIRTSERALFHVEDQTVAMGEGEIWAFDRRRTHWVSVPENVERTHLVVDVELTPALSQLLQYPDASDEARIELSDTAEPKLRFKTDPASPVASPDDIDVYVEWLCDRIRGTEVRSHRRVAARLVKFADEWRRTWERHRDRPDGWSAFRDLCEQTSRELMPASQELSFGEHITGLVLHGSFDPWNAALPESEPRLDVAYAPLAHLTHFSMGADGLKLTSLGGEEIAPVCVRTLKVLCALGAARGLNLADTLRAARIPSDAETQRAIDDLFSLGLVTRDYTKQSLNGRPQANRGNGVASLLTTAAGPGTAVGDAASFRSPDDLPLCVSAAGVASVWSETLGSYGPLDMDTLELVQSFRGGRKLSDSPDAVCDARLKEKVGALTSLGVLLRA